MLAPAVPCNCPSVAQLVDFIRKFNVPWCEVQFPNSPFPVRFPNDYYEKQATPSVEISLPQEEVLRKRVRRDSLDTTPSPKQMRVEDCSIPKTNPISEELETIPTNTYNLLRKALFKSFYFGLCPTELPTPEELGRKKAAEVDSSQYSHLLPSWISPRSHLFLALVTELEHGHAYPEIVRQCLKRRPSRDQHCKCEIRQYCACSRKYFLSPPTEAAVVKKLLKLSPTTHRKLQMYVLHGLESSSYPPEIEDIDILKHVNRNQKMVMEGFKRFLSDLDTLYRRMNIISMVDSPSTFLEALLLSRSRRPQPSKLLDTDVDGFLRYHPYIPGMKQEVDHAVRVMKLSVHDIYGSVCPLLEQLAATRRFPSLPMK